MRGFDRATPIVILAVALTGASCTFPTDKSSAVFVIVRVPRQLVVEAGEQPKLQPDGQQAKDANGNVIMVPIQFKTDSYRYFQKNIARFPEELPARFLEFKRGIVLNEIIRAMKSPRSLLIFDLSNINANVLFELGLAIGLNRPGLPVCERGRDLKLGPLDGLVRETYQSGRILGEAFFDQLRERWTSYQAQLEDDDFVHLLNEEVPTAERALADSVLAVAVRHTSRAAGP